MVNVSGFVCEVCGNPEARVVQFHPMLCLNCVDPLERETVDCEFMGHRYCERPGEMERRARHDCDFHDCCRFCMRCDAPCKLLEVTK